MLQDHIKFQEYIDKCVKAFEDSTLIKISFVNPYIKSDLLSVNGRSVDLKKGKHLQLVYRHKTKDITKNYPSDQIKIVINQMILEQFSQSVLYTAEADYHFSIFNKSKVKLTTKSASLKSSITNHNRQKNSWINTKDPVWNLLGVCDENGEVYKTKHPKFRQITKYGELIEPHLKAFKKSEKIAIADVGCGKAYLSFALYQKLKDKDIAQDFTGVEIRKDLVEKLNGVCKNLHLENIRFKTGTIEDAQFAKLDILVALHACDTATDDAIKLGIESNAKLIVCSPCCHKQVRKALTTHAMTKNITSHGILKERYAEILTDSIRALVLEAHGYSTKVVEFISTEHTSKNLLIIAEKKKSAKDIDQSIMEEIKVLMKDFGISSHYLVESLGLVDGVANNGRE